jgi:hypothetical protein
MMLSRGCPFQVAVVPLALLGVLLALLVVSATPAFADSPWWQLSSGAAPTHLAPAKNEVQDLTVSATGGVFVLIDPATEALELFGWDATHEEVQVGLEGLYGAGNVEVNGGPGDETGSKPYEIKFTGALADQPVEGIQALSSFFGLGLEGGRHEATVTEVTKGGSGQIVVVATNLGDAAVNGTSNPVTIIDKLPPGLRATAISGTSENIGLSAGFGGGPVACSVSTLTCTYAGVLPSYRRLEITIAVVVEPGALPDAQNEVTVAGGEAPGTSVSRPVAVDSSPTPFGVEDYELAAENEDGSRDTQAGSHPFQLTTTLVLNQAADRAKPPALPKDLSFNLPPGLIGNPTPLPQCTDADFAEEAKKCPSDAVVGVASVAFTEPFHIAEPGLTLTDPLFNLKPAHGEPARFGFFAENVAVTLDTSVRTGGDYGVVVSASNVTETATLLAARVTVWGVPGDARHDKSRGRACLEALPSCVPLGSEHLVPFLTLPTSCTGPLQTTVEADSWKQPGDFQSFASSEPLQALDGCNHLGLSPSVSVAPDGQAASTPTGLAVKVHVPQETILTASGLAESDVKDLTVALPAGVQVSPSAGDGLQACSNTQIGFKGENSQTGTDEFTSELPTPLEPGVNFCPEASKVATVKIKSPLLPNALEGAVYLAAPQNFMEGPLENPFRSLVAMYIVAQDPVSGVLVKLPVRVSPDPVTGQLVATVESPQLPFEEAELHFFGGERAPLTTPALCGTYTTTASIAPWSGNEPASPSSSFEITSGAHGAPCSDPQPFAPGFQAGSTNLQAGAFTPFTLTMTRPDADQTLGRIEMRMPPGLSGTLSNVKLCGEPQAQEGKCGPESLIGETVVSAGLGGDPYTVTGGKVYITTAYGGGQYGLSIVNPAAAGPFVLDEGRPIVVRASIYVDPHTAALRIVSDPLPTILDGIPLQIQHVNVNIDRPGFTFNPTNCRPTSITGTIASSEGATVPVSTPFQVTNCATLAFKPKFAASTSGKTSRADGASLTVKLTYPDMPQGTEANIAKVKVDLPKQLPSRLTTLQKACTAAVFETNPASCPAASIVGHAKAITPILPVPLEGPAYFVSHGGEAFPSLIFVLQGYGVTEDLVATTFISKAGITSSTLKAVPDVPVGSFELNLPEEKYSALAASGNLCKSKLAMPTAFVGQNGAEIHESTPIVVTGCKPALGIVRHSVKGTTATITVSVPSAGRLVASGSGLSRAIVKTGKSGTVTVRLALSSKHQLFLSRHPGRRLKVAINLQFTPKKGAKLKTTTTVLIN